MHFLFSELQYSVNKQQKFYSLPKRYKHPSSKDPSSGISVGGRVKHACFYTSEYFKTTRDKKKPIRRILSKRGINKKCKSYYILYTRLKIDVT